MKKILLLSVMCFAARVEACGISKYVEDETKGVVKRTTEYFLRSGLSVQQASGFHELLLGLASEFKKQAVRDFDVASCLTDVLGSVSRRLGWGPVMIRCFDLLPARSVIEGYGLSASMKSPGVICLQDLINIRKHLGIFFEEARHISDKEEYRAFRSKYVYLLGAENCCALRYLYCCFKNTVKMALSCAREGVPQSPVEVVKLQIDEKFVRCAVLPTIGDGDCAFRAVDPDLTRFSASCEYGPSPSRVWAAELLRENIGNTKVREFIASEIRTRKGKYTCYSGGEVQLIAALSFGYAFGMAEIT
jgi:hypothetical protein